MSSEVLSKKFSVVSFMGKTVSGRDHAAEKGKIEELPESSPIDDVVVPIDDDIEGMDEDGGFGLYEHEYGTRPPLPSVIHKLSAYTGGIEPTANETKLLRHKQVTRKAKQKLGTFLGVFLPCIQNIFGVLLFVRMPWIAGVAGGLQFFLMVGFCCLCTTITTLSMSAIATNGKVPAGGSYFMISRSIGPEFGGAVGILFYLGTSMAAAMYLVGSVEVFLKYVCPQASLFGDVSDSASLFNNTRVYGTILTFLVMVCVFIGIRFVSKFSVLSLAAVLLSIFCIYIGIFTASPARSPYVCALGGRLIAKSRILENGTLQCHKNITGPLYQLYCGRNNSFDACEFFNSSNVTEFPAIPGLASNMFYENVLTSYYREAGHAYDDISFPPSAKYGQASAIADITTSFTILLAIFFPSVTGLMAGSNRSGDLANPQFSIPVGTLCAVMVTSFVYLSTTLFFPAVADGRVLRDKFGESMGGEMLVAALAWPHYWVIRIGTLLASIGAGLQCLTGAPRLLQAIAQDEVISFLSIFKVVTKRGEPLRAQLLTYAISQCAVLIASIDAITPLITMFFLLCYGFVNLATALNDYLKEPSWRPRFKYHHWLLSSVGVCICLTLMFISSWYYALVALVIAGGIYKYIEYMGASKEWGDATRGLQFTAATRAILALGTKPIHTKNWRPQLLVYVPVRNDLSVGESNLLHLVRQLKAGKGLTLVTTILEGDICARKDDVEFVKTQLDEQLLKCRVKGLASVIVAQSVAEGMKNMVQSAGLGNLRHNTILLTYPEDWRQTEDKENARLLQFTSILRTAQACSLAILMPRFIEAFPQSKDTALTGTVDLWFIVHDGGILLLTAYLLLRNRVWCKCRLRVFVVTSEPDPNGVLKNVMTRFIYDLRISAEVEIVEMSKTDISAYALQRTVAADQRRELLKEMKCQDVAAKSDLQTVIDEHYVGVREGADGEIPVPPKPTKKASIFKVFISGPAQDSPGNAISEERRESKGKTDVNLLNPVREVKKACDADDRKKGNKEEKGDEGGRESEDDKKSMNQHSVTFAEGVAGMKKSGSQDGSDGDTPSSENSTPPNQRLNEFTFSPSALRAAITGDGEFENAENVHNLSGKKTSSPRRLHSAKRLNELIVERSADAAAVLINLPALPKSPGSEFYYMEYVETLTDGLKRVILIRGSGREVITAFAE
ncbi:solute carrier family 12 [Echinococcus multilocularis]|uniref:Solute carrier family 12 n=1 Tax=Echinococcus multilocularis TaxID=6211 RepID=A0A087VXN7_ECHMU|nr:solute carrier family 12 [Echinococcus multilocularis]